MSTRSLLGPAALSIVCLTAGCARYGYDLVAPVARPLSSGDAQTFDLPPLRYAVGVEDDRVAIRVDNPTGDTVRLSGRDSSVVDPAGRSHPLVDQTIAPQAYVVVVLPPLRPWFGAIAAIGPSTADDDPGYDRASPVYWDWPGPGEARVRLVYRRPDGSTFGQDLTVRRRKE